MQWLFLEGYKNLSFQNIEHSPLNKNVKERIGIFIYGYGLGNSPSLINAGKFLADLGYSVDYFTFNTYIGNLQFNNPNINIYQLNNLNRFPNQYRENPLKTNFPSVYSRLCEIYSKGKDIEQSVKNRLLFVKRVKEYEKQYLKDINTIVLRIKNIIEVNKYKCFFGVEPEGLTVASIIGKEHNIPVIYYSLELLLTKEIKEPRHTIRKKYERIYSKDAYFTITLDYERASLLSEDNELSLSQFVIVPVCADGPAIKNKTDWFRKKFILSKDDKIILHAGFISKWSMCEEIAKNATSWPDNRILVLHSHGYNDNYYLQKVKKYVGKKVKISMDPVNYDDLPALLSSGDIGIALYRDLGKNFTLIGSASGKLSHYLKCGLPVILNDYPNIREMIDSYKCGRCIGRPQDIRSTIEYILNNYETLRVNAFKCYEEKYMFSKYFHEVIERIENL